ncbi:hypothetical protein HKD37_14G039898 [Glycine soja]
MKNSWWGQELHPYNQYEDKERTPNLESVFAEFMAYHASSTTHRNSMQNQDIHVGTSYSMENYQWEQELQPYNQYEEERSSNMDSLLMQFKETVEYTQRAFKSLEIQVGKLAEHVAKFFATREENFVEVEAHEESLVEKHDSREKDEEKSEEKAQQWEKCSQVEIQQESILQVNNPPHQLIVKEERHGEHKKTLSVILSLITSTSLAMIWKVFLKYMSFMEFLAKRRKCKEDVFYVTFMPP